MTVWAWLGEKVADKVAENVFQNASAMYNNTKAYEALKKLLQEASKSRPAECKQGDISVSCPAEGFTIPHIQNKKAGGTDTLNMYNLSKMDGTKIHVQFFDIQEKIYVWEYTEDWKPKDKGKAYDPVEALAKIKDATGFGVEPASPHI